MFKININNYLGDNFTIERYAKEHNFTMSNKGDLYHNNHKLKGCVDCRGYKTTTIRIKEKVHRLYYHRFKAYLLYNNDIYKKGIVVRHLDGNKLNNSDENITLGSQKDNMMDIPKKERQEHAEYAASFLKLYDYEKVKQLRSEGKTYTEIMYITGIKSKGTVSRIINTK